MSTKDEDSLELAVESVLADYLMRCDQGTTPDREQFLASNPAMRQQLEAILAAADWIEQLAGPTLGSSAVNQNAVAQVSAAPRTTHPSQMGPESTGVYGPEMRAFSDGRVHRSGGGEELPLPASDPNEETQPLLPRDQSRPGSAAPSAVGGSFWSQSSPRDGQGAQEGADPNAATVNASGSIAVPMFSLGSLTRTQELSQPVLPCRFGDYVLESVLGRGGMGVVYAGRQAHLDRAVAIKMIRSGALASSEEVQRFYTEARSAAQLDHPNIVTVYQCGEHEGHHYFSMDLVAGTDLSKLIQDGPMECRRAARYVRDVARAIQFAHARGILHRDIKPANVLVDETDQVHITDFGLAKSIGHDTGLTATGAALGTPSYMSPEQAAGRVDEHAFQTDVYSMGAVLFALLTGKPPFHGSSVVQTILQVLHRPAPLARQAHPSVPLDLETVIAKCLHKTPDRRYSSAQELADDLDRYLRDEPILARPLSSLRRAVYWSMGIPIVGALIGRRVIEPSASHTWTQRTLLAIGFICVAILIAWLPLSSWQSQQLPKTIRVATGQPGGSYDFVGRVISDKLTSILGRPALPEISEGSVDNSQRLLDRRVAIALLQATNMKSNEIAVIAPLYYEAIHVLARQGAGIRTISDLMGRNVIVGPDGSGSRSVAKRILQKHHLELSQIEPISTEWLSIDQQPTVDAAIVVVQVGNARMNELLGSGEFKLLPLNDAVKFSLDDPAFHLLPLTTEHYPSANLPQAGINTVATTAYLATRVDCPDVLVTTTLEVIYSPEVITSCKLLSAEKVADWQVSWHRAADAYFEQFRSR